MRCTEGGQNTHKSSIGRRTQYLQVVPDSQLSHKVFLIQSFE